MTISAPVVLTNETSLKPIEPTALKKETITIASPQKFDDRSSLLIRIAAVPRSRSKLLNSRDQNHSYSGAGWWEKGKIAALNLTCANFVGRSGC